MEPIAFEDFLKVDMRVGRVLAVGPLPKARVPAYELTIDFGELGVKKSSARVTDLYPVEDLPGRLVVAVVNFEPKRIAGFLSEVLVLGLAGEGGVVLLAPEREVALGQRVF
ncbi:tRNA-binding protein [Solidesulfovibrio sp.]|uniref:tRNA-binding protein n=1 Tax=Solidesulfovibrio sp. TaxID=2910990 RepID=UPI002605CEB4|nr:tRNA-binding protein [Solidesulfovibrio sp.]